MQQAFNRRILLIDDTPAIHDHFRKILGSCRDGEMELLEREIFAAAPLAAQRGFELDAVAQGSDGLERVLDSLKEGRPYAVAFVELVLPPGWDGVETVVRLWEADPRIQVVICTAHTDQSWERVLGRLEVRDQLLILKKPCESVEILQLASALAAKWEANRRAELKLAELEELVQRRTSQLLALDLDLSAAREEADRANRVKGEFLANISHEIRTPMNTVLGMTDLTLQTELTPTQQLFLGKARAAAEALMGVMEEILDYSAIESGSLSLKPQQFLLRELLDRLAEEFRCKAQLKGVKLELAPAPEPLPPLVGDPLRLGQVLAALLDNAVKFTESGEVSLRVEATERHEASVVLRFAVRDTGIGIDPADTSRIFHPFSQVDASTTRKNGGTGLGLAIAESLVQLMGGELTVASRPGRGSEFSFCVSFSNGKQLRPGGDAAADLLPFPHPAGISVADGLRYCCDDPALYRNMLARFLDKAGVAAEIGAAVAAGRKEQAAREAHSLIAVAATIGAGELSQTARALERELRYGAGEKLPVLLKDLIVELDRVTGSIRSAIGTAGQTLPAARLCEPLRLREMLDEMTRLFDYDLDQALTLKRRLHEELQGTVLAEDFGRMERLIDGFDFDAALRVRHKLDALLDGAQGRSCPDGKEREER